MLKGKIIHDGYDYSVKIGSITVDITHDVRELIAREYTHARTVAEQELVSLRANYASIVDRYNQIARIVLASEAGMPTAEKGRDL